MSPPDWYVQVPLSQLVALQDAIAEIESLRMATQLLSQRIDGLHKTQYELMEIINDLRKKLASQRTGARSAPGR